MIGKNHTLRRILRRFHKRMLSNTSPLLDNAKDEDMSRIRNIGILAHIDAGKTTTTERMLFYSGRIRMMGEVHQGNTVTDYLEQERNRGITITSAAVTFNWLKHKLNLIDTPGHIDFTMEVEQALHVIDGAIVVLDSSAGVEAQTVTVWRQADNCHIPRIVYANKMDRSDGNIDLCISSVESKLGVCPLPLQIPLRDGNRLIGIIDIIKKEKCLWKGDRGQELRRIPLVESDGKEWEEVMLARSKLADKLTDIDDTLADVVINLDSIDQLHVKDLEDSVRRTTLSQTAVPLICGSSYKNIGVQLLMDSIVKYLPAPMECPYQKTLSDCFKSNLSGRAFKIIHDKQRGPITFLRIYSGSLTKGQKIYNLKSKKMEQISKLMVALADEYEEVKDLHAGNVAAVAGLKHTMTGDLISTSNNAMTSAKNNLMSENKLSEEEADRLLGVTVNVPDPVFFCSIEPASLRYQVPLEAALNELQREDPSLRVIFDSETGQTVLGGMGELHLEIIKQRVESEHKVEVDLGPLQIAYKEQLVTSTKYCHEVKHRIANSNQWVKVILSAKTTSEQQPEKAEFLKLDKSPDSVANVMAVKPRQLLLMKQGLNSGILHGPLMGAPVININFTLHWLEVGRGTSEPVFIAAVAQCVQKIFELGGTLLLEPMMALEIITNADSFSPVLSDLSMRRAGIEQIGIRGVNKTVSAVVPLSELLGYSKDLRIITSGHGSFTMEFLKYQEDLAADDASKLQSMLQSVYDISLNLSISMTSV